MFFTQKNPCRGGARQGINGSIFGTVKPKRKARAIYTIRKQIARIEAKRYLRRLTEVVSSGDGIRLPLHIYFTIFLVNVNNFLTEFTVFLKTTLSLWVCAIVKGLLYLPSYAPTRGVAFARKGFTFILMIRGAFGPLGQKIIELGRDKGNRYSLTLPSRKIRGVGNS